MEQLNENQLKVKRAETVMQIGEFYYKKFREQSATPADEIQGLVNTVAEFDLQIARVSGAWMTQEGICPRCSTQVDETTAFCPNCGYSMKEYKEQFVGTCNRCNAKIRTGQKFCDVCGVRLD